MIPAGCEHKGAEILAYLGPRAARLRAAIGADVDVIAMLGWTAIGRCGDCGVPVVSVTVSDPSRRTDERGVPGWSTPWIELAKQGHPDAPEVPLFP